MSAGRVRDSGRCRKAHGVHPLPGARDADRVRRTGRYGPALAPCRYTGGRASLPRLRTGRSPSPRPSDVPPAPRRTQPRDRRQNAALAEPAQTRPGRDSPHGLGGRRQQPHVKGADTHPGNAHRRIPRRHGQDAGPGLRRRAFPRDRQGSFRSHGSGKVRHQRGIRAPGRRDQTAGALSRIPQRLASRELERRSHRVQRTALRRLPQRQALPCAVPRHPPSTSRASISPGSRGSTTTDRRTRRTSGVGGISPGVPARRSGGPPPSTARTGSSPWRGRAV